MNERMNELDKAAQEYAGRIAGNDEDSNYVAWFNIYKEKFAELIVQECDYLIQQQVSLKYKDGWEQYGLSEDWACGHYGASILSRTVIKQHFGVEE